MSREVSGRSTEAGLGVYAAQGVLTCPEGSGETSMVLNHTHTCVRKMAGERAEEEPE